MPIKIEAPKRVSKAMNIIMAHPTGNANVRAAAKGFNQARILSKFYTSIATFDGDILDKLSSIGPLSELKRRKFDISLKDVTHTWPWKETGRLLATKAGYSSLVKHESGKFSVDAVYHSLDKHVASRLKLDHLAGVKSVYGYEDGAAGMFQVAKELGLKCFYDLPIGYWKTARRMLKVEQEKWPDWAETLVGMSDSPSKLARKDLELQLADRIYVASRFTADTLNDHEGLRAPIEVIPYGFPDVAANRTYRGPASQRKIKLLFVGRMEQRKGVANMFAAVAKIRNHVELTVVGVKSTENCAALNSAVAEHKYIPNLPHADILELMKQHDVLLFPSLFEGFGLVITEAMSQGTPVITTERTAGPDLIDHDENGWLTEAGSTEGLLAAIENIISRPSRIISAGKAAMETARRRPWEVYGKELANSIITNSK
jgi:glycosyltransferase involved in cell wall biosynthesis